MKGLASFNQSEIRDDGFYMPGSEGDGTITVSILWSIILAGEMSRKLVMTKLLSYDQEEQWKGKVHGTTRAYSRGRSSSGTQGYGSDLLIEGRGDTWVHEVEELGTGLWGGPEMGSY